MNGLILALVLCSQAPQNATCEVWKGDSGGTGTVLMSAKDGHELVLTARHVVRNQGSARVKTGGKSYAAAVLRVSNTDDLAVVETDLPGVYPTLGLTHRAPSTATVMGFGRSRSLHSHDIRYIGRLGIDGEDEYTPGGNEGDSGGGVFDSDGDLCGVFVAKRTDNRNAIVVPGFRLCQFVNGQMPASGSKRVVIFPFFWKRVQWSGGSTGSSCPDGSCPQPSGGVTVQAPGVGVQVGQQGAQGQKGDKGDTGAAGQNGKDADPAALDALKSMIAANAQAIAILTGQVQQIKNQPAAEPLPFFFQIQKPDGTLTTQVNALQQDPNINGGKPFYALRLNASQLASTTVPVTPIQGK